ncbi:hypothetical protein HDA42_007449 [Streptomyces costaricanus]|uniref:Uncharacterized protein n=1 Tax=Streptomyces murinus TaxID=33900 RepID=A0A7W3NX08_STRMR|nr:hypothetical protein [Streptomyces murinus]
MLPLLHLHGLSSGDFAPALEQFLGGSAGLSPATVTRLTQRPPEDAKSCVLVLVGLRTDGSEERVALKDGHRESGVRAFHEQAAGIEEFQERPHPRGRAQETWLDSWPIGPSVQHMQPEQLRISSAVDVWGTGCLLAGTWRPITPGSRRKDARTRGRSPGSWRRSSGRV